MSETCRVCECAAVRPNQAKGAIERPLFLGERFAEAFRRIFFARASRVGLASMGCSGSRPTVDHVTSDGHKAVAVEGVTIHLEPTAVEVVPLTDEVMHGLSPDEKQVPIDAAAIVVDPARQRRPTPIEGDSQTTDADPPEDVMDAVESTDSLRAEPVVGTTEVVSSQEGLEKPSATTHESKDATGLEQSHKFSSACEPPRLRGPTYLTDGVKIVPVEVPATTLFAVHIFDVETPIAGASARLFERGALVPPPDAKLVFTISDLFSPPTKE